MSDTGVRIVNFYADGSRDLREVSSWLKRILQIRTLQRMKGRRRLANFYILFDMEFDEERRRLRQPIDFA